MIKIMRKKVIYLLFILFTGGSLIVYAADSPLDDTYFLGEVPDSAAIGRGQAYTGVIGSPFAPYWNPAGLVKLEKNGFGVSLNIRSESDLEDDIVKESYALEGRKLNFISVCSNKIGFFWRPLVNRVDKSSGIINGMNYEEELDVKVNMFGVSVAVPHADRIDFGMNINFISGIIGYSKIEGSDPMVEISGGLGWGLDWGLIYRIFDNLNLGLALMNAPAWIYWEEYSKDRLPMIFRAGADLQLNKLMSFGIDYENGLYDDCADNDIIHVGIEQYVTKNFLLRAGMYGNDFDDKYKTTYTFGVGYKMASYNIDIAAKQYYLPGNNSEILRRLSLSGIVPF
jgi:hypothetical protein